MYPESLIGLVNNAALLLALGILYDLLSYRLRGQGRPFFQQILVGVVLSAVGVAIMLNPWDFGQGVVFDTRSVLLCLTGFFFGTVPVALAVLATGAFRLFQGGTGAWTGVAVIVTSGGIGLAWRYFRRNRKSDPTLGELYLLGLVVHMAMLGWMLSLPRPVAWEVLSKITLPVILIYPLATALLGKLLLNRENRKLLEVMIRESEEKFRNIFQHHSAVQLILDPDTGNIVEANEAAEKFYGWPAPELKAMRIQDLNTLSPEAVQAAMEKAGSPQHAHFEFNHRLADGSIRDVEVYSGKIEVGGKKLLHSIIHDITARKRAQEALREREHFLRSVIQTAVDGFWVVDSRGRLTEVNDAYCVMSGYSREELSGVNIHDLDAIETTEEIAARIGRVRASGWEIFETRHRRKDGSAFPVSMSVTYLDEEAGHFICFSRDLTESRLAEEQLIKSHDLLTNLARLVPGVIYQFRLYPDGSSAFPYASPGMNDIYEVTPEEVRENATAVYGRLHPDDYSQVADAIQESARTLQTFYCQFRVLLPRQGLRWRWSQAQPERMADGSILWHGIILDITQRVQAEEALRKSEERLNFALHMSQTGGWELDLIDHTAHRTLEHDRIFGYESLLPSWTYEMFIDHILPEDRPEVERLFQEAAAAQADWKFECRIRRVDGEVRWIRAAGCHTPDETGQMRRMAGIVQDITDRKKAEEEKDKLNAQLLQAQKMESVGRGRGARL